MVPWLGELARTLPALARSYLPGAPIDARSREQVILAVTEVNGCRYCAWIHGSWADYLGQVEDPADVVEVLLAHARASAEAGTPLDPAPLLEVLPPEVVAGLRATVAQIEVANLVGNTVDGLLARATRRRPLDPPKALAEIATVAVALPVAVPLLAVGGAMRALGRLAPAVPAVEMPPPGEANLLVHLLARAVPSYLANAGLRLALLNLPAPLVVGITAGRTSATLRVGRGAIVLANGIQPDAALVVEGDVEPLLQVATGHLVREIGSLRVKRP
jgi:AhpD family alkylhydroperoxidase